MEVFVPIKIKHVTIHQPLGIVTRENTEYYNVLVRECPEYIQNPCNKDNYIRSSCIKRYCNENVQWPDHPLSPEGEHMGAIIIIRSKDDKYLLVRNGKLWGLPKGVRNYCAFTQLQDACNKIYLETGEIPVFTDVSFVDVETPEENIIRETREETGIMVNPKRLFRYKKHNSYHPYIRFYYHYEYNAEEYVKTLEENGTDHENDEIMWQTQQEMLKLLTKHREDSNKRIFNHVTYSYLMSYFKCQNKKK